jgi:hypothetical protein
MLADATFARSAQNPLRRRSWYPPFAKEREGRGIPLCWECQRDQKPGLPVLPISVWNRRDFDLLAYPWELYVMTF